MLASETNSTTGHYGRNVEMKVALNSLARKKDKWLKDTDEPLLKNGIPQR